MKKRSKIIYWTATGLLSLMMILSASMYILNYKEVSEVFIDLGYNSRIVRPLAILKLLGIIAIVSNKSKIIKEWAYFGFLIDFLLALEAHLNNKDGEHTTVITALALWTISYLYYKKQ